jgi:hypothetical protein
VVTLVALLFILFFFTAFFFLAYIFASRFYPAIWPIIPHVVHHLSTLQYESSNRTDRAIRKRGQAKFAHPLPSLPGKRNPVKALWSYSNRSNYIR